MKDAHLPATSCRGTRIGAEFLVRMNTSSSSKNLRLKVQDVVVSHPACFFGCGTCGYELNLTSSNRNTSTIGSKYGKSIKREMIAEEEEATKLEFSEDEEALIARMFSLVGERWSLIAGRIPGRSAEEIEKYWTSMCTSSSE
ncbi:MYB-like transcription factor ETC3 [Senna tora]|uniref:MYB-like transcription factor ETC3 n=1 Tax=Senna tora TaxID=362788 RepID=A0A835CF98_9FABA|nr:MYB-like transcription factor ETC3 [Senna tora]